MNFGLILVRSCGAAPFLGIYVGRQLVEKMDAMQDEIH